MPDASLEIFGLIAAAVAFAFGLRGLSNRLRKRVGIEVGIETRPHEPASEPRDPTGKYFLVAIVGFVLHVGSFYFYLWGAAAGSVGLAGMMVMLVVGFCLMVAIFYSWARRESWGESALSRSEGEPSED